MTVRQMMAGVRWYLREVSGETNYERRRQDERNENPRARCC